VASAFFTGGDKPTAYATEPRPPGVTPGRQHDVVTAGQITSTENTMPSWMTPRSRPRITQYEMAFAMQTSCAGLDRHQQGTAAHSRSLRAAKPGDGSFASNCLLARRLAERGVRFIQL